MMKNEVLYLLLDRYADHEAVFLASAIACDERNVKEHPKYIKRWWRLRWPLSALVAASAHCPITRSTPCLMIMPHWC